MLEYSNTSVCNLQLTDFITIIETYQCHLTVSLSFLIKGYDYLQHIILCSPNRSNEMYCFCVQYVTYD